LVLSGGGALGSWQAAALLALEKEGLEFDSVLGFSAGALTGVYYCLGRMAEGVEGWRRHEGGTLTLRPRLFPPSIFSNAPIAEAVPFIKNDDEAKTLCRRRLIVVSALRSRARAISAIYTPGGSDGWDGPLLPHLLASCAIPVVFPPVRLNFRGESVALFDGGVPCAEPMSFSALAHCRDIITLDVVRPDEVGRPGSGILGRIDQRARETMRTLIGQGLGSLTAASDPPRIFRLAPSKILGYTMLDFNNITKIAGSLDQGQEDASRFLENPADFAAIQ
jgi:predicted acylesterase/phospholipase RssA